MAFDYKKEYKEFYMPKGTSSIVTVPKMNYIAVRGSGNPNDADGEYKQAIGLLYGIAFTIKMSKKEDNRSTLPQLELSGLLLSVAPLIVAVFVFTNRNEYNYANIYLKISMILAGGIVGDYLGLLLHKENREKCGRNKQFACVIAVFGGLFQIIFSFVNLLNAPLDTTIIKLEFFEYHFFILIITHLALFLLSLYILKAKK